MEVYGYDPYISVNAAWNLSRSVKHISNVEDIYKECDYITIHVPLLDSTRKMIDANAITMIAITIMIFRFFFLLIYSKLPFSSIIFLHFVFLRSTDISLSRPQNGTSMSLPVLRVCFTACANRDNICSSRYRSHCPCTSPADNHPHTPAHSPCPCSRKGLFPPSDTARHARPRR